MKNILWLLFVSCASVVVGCGGGSSGSTDSESAETTDLAAVDAQDTVLPLPEWAPLDGAVMEGIKTLKGFACTPGLLHLSFVGNTTEGLYSMEVAAGTGFAQAFTGVGILQGTDAGVLIATEGGREQSSALTLVTPDGTATDTGFALPATEIRAVNYVNNFVITMSKNWEQALYTAHRGNLAAGVFEQVAGILNETGMSLHATADAVYLLVQINEYSGTGCRTAPITAGEQDKWTPCPGFPEFVKYKEGQAYSVKAALYGDAEHLAVWFRVNDKGVDKYRHYVLDGAGSWTEIAGFPNGLPTATWHDGEYLYVGYSGSSGDEAVYRAPADGSAPAKPFGRGFGDPAEKSGVVGFCADGQTLYAAWLDFALSGSTVSIYSM